MSFSSAFRGNFNSLPPQCCSCSDRRFQSSASLTLIDRPTITHRGRFNLYHVSSRLATRKNLEVCCRAGEDESEKETETDPEKNDDKEEGIQGERNNQSSSDATMQRLLRLEQLAKGKDQGPSDIRNSDNYSMVKNDAGEPLSKGGIKDGGNKQSSSDATTQRLLLLEQLTKGKGQETSQVRSSDSNNMGKNDANEPLIQGEIQDKDSLEVASGLPLPGLKPPIQMDESFRISKEAIDILKDEVFGFDTFFITSQEPYEGGVLFKGNLRGTADQSYEKIVKRMQDKFGDEYKFFLLINPEDDKPIAVVVPRKTFQTETTAVPEWVAAGAFGLVTVFTLLLRNVPALQSNLLSSFDNLDMLKDGLSGAIVTAIILGTHELGHYIAAKDCGVKLGVPYFIPSWQIGSFGAITRIVNIVPKREDLLKVAVAGPLAGFSLGIVLFLLGLILPPSDGIGVVVDASVFHESFLAGGIAKLLLGEALKEGTPISVNPLAIWAWAGLLINAINSIPAGELDGGRIALSIWGRKISSRLSAVSIGLLGLSAIFSDVAFYWVVLIVFLQRRPIAPLSEEITDPDNKYIGLGVATLLLGLLVCLPYPFLFSSEAMSTL